MCNCAIYALMKLNTIQSVLLENDTDSSPICSLYAAAQTMHWMFFGFNSTFYDRDTSAETEICRFCGFVCETLIRPHRIDSHTESECERVKESEFKLNSLGDAVRMAEFVIQIIICGHLNLQMKFIPIFCSGWQLQS